MPSMGPLGRPGAGLWTNNYGFYLGLDNGSRGAEPYYNGTGSDITITAIHLNVNNSDGSNIRAITAALWLDSCWGRFYPDWVNGWYQNPYGWASAPRSISANYNDGTPLSWTCDFTVPNGHYFYVGYVSDASVNNSRLVFRRINPERPDPNSRFIYYSDYDGIWKNSGNYYGSGGDAVTNVDFSDIDYILPYPTSISVSPQSMNLIIPYDSSFTLSAYVNPNYSRNSTAYFYSSYPGLASIDATNDQNQAAIYAHYIDNSSIVNNGAWYTQVHANTINGLDTYCNLYIFQAIEDLYIDNVPTSPLKSEVDSVQLSVELLPEYVSDSRLVWLSDNPSVATVSTTGLVSAVSPGSADIIVIANKYMSDNPNNWISKSCTINVIPSSMDQIYINNYEFEGPRVSFTISWNDIVPNTKVIIYIQNKNGFEAERYGSVDGSLNQIRINNYEFELTNDSPHYFLVAAQRYYPDVNYYSDSSNASIGIDYSPIYSPSEFSNQSTMPKMPTENESAIVNPYDIPLITVSDPIVDDSNQGVYCGSKLDFYNVLSKNIDYSINIPYKSKELNTIVSLVNLSTPKSVISDYSKIALPVSNLNQQTDYQIIYTSYYQYDYSDETYYSSNSNLDTSYTFRIDHLGQPVIHYPTGNYQMYFSNNESDLYTRYLVSLPDDADDVSNVEVYIYKNDNSNISYGDTNTESLIGYYSLINNPGIFSSTNLTSNSKFVIDFSKLLKSRFFIEMIKEYYSYILIIKLTKMSENTPMYSFSNPLVINMIDNPSITMNTNDIITSNPYNNIYEMIKNISGSYNIPLVSTGMKRFNDIIYSYSYSELWETLSDVETFINSWDKSVMNSIPSLNIDPNNIIRSNNTTYLGDYIRTLFNGALLF